MNKMRLSVVALAGAGAMAWTSARAQSTPPADMSAPPAALDSAGAPAPSAQPPAFVPAPVAPGTGPKTGAKVVEETDAEAKAAAETEADRNRNDSEKQRQRAADLAPPAIRQDTPADVFPAVPPAEPVRAAPALRPVTQYNLYRLGAALLMGGGFQQFTNGNLQDMTGGGGFWNARAVLGTRQYVGLEAAYVGSAHNMNALGFGNRAALISNGAEGAMRINLPVVQGRSLFEPFGFVGVGWSRYSVVNTNTASSDVATLDDLMTVPYGGGFAIAQGPFIVDARFTYRSTYFNDLMRTSGGRLDSWTVGGQLGASF